MTKKKKKKRKKVLNDEIILLVSDSLFLHDIYCSSFCMNIYVNSKEQTSCEQSKQMIKEIFLFVSPFFYYILMNIQHIISHVKTDLIIYHTIYEVKNNFILHIKV